jgi:hypothetical protein
VKSLKDKDALREYVAGIEKTNTEPANLNVLARLYKVAAVKKVVDDAIEELKAIFTPSHFATPAQSGDQAGPKKRKKATAQEGEDAEMLDISDEDEDPFTAFSARIAAPSSGEDDSEGSISDGERPPSIGDSESEHDPEADLEADSESEEAEASDEEDEASDDDSGAIDRRIAPPSDMSGSDSDASSVVISKPTRTKDLREKPTSSAFLPTLSHANYIAGSDSDASDLSADFAPRKNRRGQRARQKIAEAKFGAKAKHLEKEDRNAGWDAKRGAVGGYGPLQSGENTIPLGAPKKEEKKRDDKGELHPSWQAAKEAKEKKMIKIDVGSKGLGKKVVFD